MVDAKPHALPRTYAGNISGVLAYKTALKNCATVSASPPHDIFPRTHSLHDVFERVETNVAGGSLDLGVHGH